MKANKGNYLFPPHRQEYEDCKQILKLSLMPCCKVTLFSPGLHYSIPGHQVVIDDFA